MSNEKLPEELHKFIIRKFKKRNKILCIGNILGAGLVDM